MMNRPHFPELFQASEIEISNYTPSEDRIKVSSTSIAYDIFNCAWDKNKIEHVEQSKVLLLNNTGQCIGVIHLPTQSGNLWSFDTRLVLTAAIKTNASAIILVQNHLGGNVTPSNDEILLTKALVLIATVMGVKIVDHLILSKNGFFSFRNHNIMPE